MKNQWTSNQQSGLDKSSQSTKQRKLPLSYQSNQSGQALVALLVFMVVGLVVTTSAIAISITGTASSFASQQGTLAYYVAEAGIENAILRLLRDPSYTGEVLTLEAGIATVVVTGSGPITIQSTGVTGRTEKTIQVIVDYNNNVLSIQNGSWKTIQL